MEYYYSFQNWLYQTDLYQNILREMPAPLNNIYFDTVLVLGVAVYVIYRGIETIRIACYHKRIRKKQAQERRNRRDKEQEMLFREKQVQEKEERIGRFMDYMEFLFRSRMRSSDAADQSDTVGQRKRLGFRGLFLEKKDKSVPYEVNPVSSASDYDAVMENYAYDEQREEEISRKREKENEEVFSILHTLDDELRVEALGDNMDKATGKGSDTEIEKRKERARKAEEKERKKAEKLLKKERGGGAGHGRFGKFLPSFFSFFDFIISNMSLTLA